MAPFQLTQAQQTARDDTEGRRAAAQAGHNQGHQGVRPAGTGG
jgi:hypothetical protein